jgi:hypothetical protein
MKWLVFFVGLLISVHSARAEENKAPSLTDRMKSLVPSISVPALSDMPSLALPSMPDLSMPDFSRMTDGMVNGFNTFTQQIGDTVPILEEMGYEVSAFRVLWGLPPTVKLRLRSTGAPDPGKLQAITAKAAAGGMVMRGLVFSAAEAKRIQSNMKLGTAIVDVEFAAVPKVRMSFLNAKPEKGEAFERDTELLDLVCAQALHCVPSVGLSAAPSVPPSFNVPKRNLAPMPGGGRAFAAARG